MNKKYRKEYVRSLGLVWLNENLSLAALSRRTGIPYDTIKFFKKKGFYFINFNNYSYSEAYHYISDRNRVVPLKRLRVRTNQGLKEYWASEASSIKSRKSIFG